MELQKLTIGIVGLVVGIVVVSGLLIPITQSSQDVVGTPIEFKNTENTTYLTGEYVGDTIIDIAVDGVVILTINDVAHPLEAVANTNIIISDAVSANSNSSGTVLAITFADGSTKSVSSGHTARMEFVGGVLTASYDGAEVYSGAYHALYSLKDNGPMRYKTFSESNPVIIRSIKDIAWSGAISGITGVFCISHGVLYAPEGNYTLDATLTKHDGTTDLYDLTALAIVETVDGEPTTHSVTRLNVPIIVEGHESSGAAYSLVGVVSLLAIVAVVVSAAAMISVRRS